MLFKGKKEVKRLEKILKDYTPSGDPVVATHSFVKEFLNPQPDRYDLTYRYEHSLHGLSFFVKLWRMLLLLN